MAKYDVIDRFISIMNDMTNITIEFKSNNRVAIRLNPVFNIFTCKKTYVFLTPRHEGKILKSCTMHQS